MREPLKAAWSLLSETQRAGAILLAVLLAVGALFELAAVSVLVPAIRVVQEPGAYEGNRAFQMLFGEADGPRPASFYVWVFLGIWIVYLCKNLCLLAINRYQFNFIGGVQSDLASRLFKHYLGSSYEFFIESNSAVLVRSVTEDVKNVVVLIFLSAITIVTEFLVALPLVLFIVWLSPVMAMATVTVGVLCFIFLRKVIAGRLKHVGEVIQADSARLIQNVQEGVGGIKELKVLAREPFYQAAFDELAANYARGLNQHLFYNTIPRLMLEVAFVLVFVCLLLVPSLSGDLYASLPVFAVYAAVAFRLIPGLNRAAGGFNSLNMGQASLDILVQGLRPHGDAHPEAVGTLPLTQGFESLAFDNVSFRFSDGSLAIDRMNLEIRAGEKIGVIGESGAGKSTLVDLVLGLLVPAEGRIVANGADIQTDIPGWQALLGYVPQSIFLVDRSLRSNIALGRSDDEIDDDNVWAALAKANLAAYVRSLPNGLDTMVGERGVKFSGGQRQRVGIARALYRNPRLLVLDEATSALDDENERQVMAEVAQLTSETVIIVAHRLTTLASCDRILEIDKGRIRAERQYSDIVDLAAKKE